MIIDYFLEDNAWAPEKAHSTDAGFDLRCPQDQFYIVEPDKQIVIDTGVHMFIPRGYCGLMVSKSGLNVKNGILTTGLVDADYTGSIKVKMYNHSRYSHTVNGGDKITQIMILPVPDVQLRETKLIPQNVERGDNGFGSTGR